jgi:hypothetical protein
MSQTVFPLRYRLITIPNISSPMELPHNLSTKAFLHRVPMKQSVLGAANEDRSPMLEFLVARDISAFVRTPDVSTASDELGTNFPYPGYCAGLPLSMLLGSLFCWPC